MTKNPEKESQKKRFEKSVQEMVDAGELNPTDADEALDRAMDKIALPSGDKCD